VHGERRQSLSGTAIFVCGTKQKSVEFALRAITQKYVLDGYPDPWRALPTQQSLDLPIARLLKKYGDEDPPPEPKLAVPISAITAIAEKYRWTAHLSMVTDLVIIAFFYLLRVGEYTSPATPRKKQTIPLRDCDIRQWNSAGHLISHSAGFEMLLQADSATICMAHPMNGTKGAVVHHSRGRGSICSVVCVCVFWASGSRGSLVITQNQSLPLTPRKVHPICVTQ